MRLPITFALIAVCVLPATLGAAESRPLAAGGWGTLASPVTRDGTGTAALARPKPERALIAGPRTPDVAALYPSYAWPLGRVLRDGLVLVNYVDHDPSAAVLDYSGGTHSYDGHAGIDYGLFNFRLMDRGCPVVAAAPGTVTLLSTETPFDRHCDFDWPDDGNWIEVSNGDGTYAYYLHLRAESRTVNVGEIVTTGQLLGLVGSSGYSTAPHLHFETGDYLSGPYQWRDPYTGPSNPLPSLWQAQEGYVGDDPLWFSDLGVFSEAQVGGSIFNTSYCDTQEGLVQPVVYGASEARLCMWAQFQGNAGELADIEVRRPNGSVYGSFTYTVPQDVQFGWFWAWFFWNGNIPPADYGNWTYRVVIGGTPVKQTTFAVGAATVFPPRFRKAGRSYRMNGVARLDTLRRHPLSPPVSYALLGAPSFVSLVSDSVLSIAATSTQPTRSTYFRVVMTDAAARHDTAYFHIVDPSKPPESTVDVATSVGDARIERLEPRPNPFVSATTLRWSLRRAGRVRLSVYDVTGRSVRLLLDEPRRAGDHVTTWDGRSAGGVPVPPGVYLARLHALDDPVRIQRVVRVR